MIQENHTDRREHSKRLAEVGKIQTQNELKESGNLERYIKLLFAIIAFKQNFSQTFPK
jgi:hypothetical protein